MLMIGSALQENLSILLRFRIYEYVLTWKSWKYVQTDLHQWGANVIIKDLMKRRPEQYWNIWATHIDIRNIISIIRHHEGNTTASWIRDTIIPERIINSMQRFLCQRFPYGRKQQGGINRDPRSSMHVWWFQNIQRKYPTITRSYMT